MNSKPLSRGLRNLNPGNIRHSKVRYRDEVTPSRDAEFREFRTIEAGYRAMFVLLHTYRLKHGCTTLREMISRYAPPSENNTENYIRRVAYATHLSPDEVIFATDGATMTAVVASMSKVENGVSADMEQVWSGWRLFIADFPPK